jgi:hypothetical protein
MLLNRHDRVQTRFAPPGWTRNLSQGSKESAESSALGKHILRNELSLPQATATAVTPGLDEG